MEVTGTGKTFAVAAELKVGDVVRDPDYDQEITVEEIGNSIILHGKKTGRTITLYPAEFDARGFASVPPPPTPKKR